MKQTNLFKVYSLAGNNLRRDVPSSCYHTNQPCEHPNGTTSEMNEQGREFYSEVFVKRMMNSQYHNGCNSCCNLMSENVNDEVPASSPVTSQHLERLKANAGQTPEVLELDDLGCEGESLSCISKADGTNFGDGCSGETDQKNRIGSSASVSFSRECSDKPVDIQSAKHGSISRDTLAEEGNKFRGSPEYAREALESAAVIYDESNPLKSSSFRDEHSGAVSPKGVSFSPARCTDLLDDSQKCSRGPVGVLKTNAEVDGSQTSSGALNTFDQKKHIETKMKHDPLEPPSQYCAISVNDNLDELVDVRVCDICGVIGREAMLAICSRCSDGAEHIYCMRVKMDKVPEDDWICEDCMIMAEAQNQKADEKKNHKALQKLSATMLRSLRMSDGSFNSGRVGVGHAFLASSGKRPGANIEGSSTKKRMLDKDVKLWCPPGSCAKGTLPKHASLKVQSKSKVTSSLARDSLGNVLQKARQPLASKSSNIESQFHKGSLFKQKCSNRTEFKTVRKCEDVHREHKTYKGSPTSRPGLHHGLTKMRKSKSFIASNFPSLDTSGSKKIVHNDFKISEVGSKRSLTQRSYSFNSKIPQLVSPLGGSSILRPKPAKATLARAEVKQQARQSYMVNEVHKDMEKNSIHRAAKRHINKSGHGFDKTVSYSIVDNRRSSKNCVRASTGLGQKADRKIVSMEAKPISKDSKLQLNDTNKAQLNRSPLAEIVHPSVDCVWRGIFNVSGCDKLSVSCTQLQAHMSSCASPEARQLVSKFPCEITVVEVLQRDIWPAQFLDNLATEDNIALYFFAEDLQSYQSYKKFFNCMVLNELALKSSLDDFELLIFPSQILPARSQRWNNLFFLWGAFRPKKSGLFDDSACVPSLREAIPICHADIVTSPQHPPLPIPAGNLSTSTQVGSGPSDALSGSVLGSGSSNRTLQSLDLTKSSCPQGSSLREVDVKIMASALLLKEQRSGQSQTKNKPEDGNRSQNQDPEHEVRTVDASSPSVSGAEIPLQPTIGFECGIDTSFTTKGKHQANIDLNHPYSELSSAIHSPMHASELPVYDVMDASSFSFSSGPSDHHHALNLELSLSSEREPATYVGDLILFPVLSNRDTKHSNIEANVPISLHLSLALPSTDNDPTPVKDDVDTSLFLFPALQRHSHIRKGIYVNKG